MYSKKELLSIPNLLCYFRILLIPVFLYTYLHAETAKEHWLSLIILVISGITDFLDGYIARHFNMITNFGKLIDPIADKLTQLAVGCTLMSTYDPYRYLVIVMILKDGMLLAGGLYLIRKNGRHLEQAKMPGKIATTAFYAVSCLLLAFYIPKTMLANGMIYLTTLLMVFAMCFYARELHQLCVNE